MKARELDAVTLDVHGTILRVVDPLPRLRELLPDYEPEAIAAAFRAEGRFYRAHVGEGRDAATLAQLHQACVGVFNDELGSALTPEQYVETITFEPIPGAVAALDRLRSLGLSLAAVANWDYSLHARLTELGLAGYFAAIVHAARKPDPAGLLLALDRLGVSPSRALHVGDEPADEQAACAAGVRFAPAPLEAAARELL